MPDVKGRARRERKDGTGMLIMTAMIRKRTVSQERFDSINSRYVKVVEMDGVCRR